MAAGGNPPQDSLNSARADTNTFHGPRAMRKSIAGTATVTIRSLNISVGPKTSTGKRKNQMSNTLEPEEIKRVKLHRVKCSQCKANLMIKPTEKVCPVCGGSLPKPGKR